MTRRVQRPAGASGNPRENAMELHGVFAPYAKAQLPAPTPKNFGRIFAVIDAAAGKAPLCTLNTTSTAYLYLDGTAV